MRPVWQAELADSFTDPRQLLTFLDLDPTELPNFQEASRNFPFRVTRCYASRMTKGDPGDPLLRQALPLKEELADLTGFVSDPVGDLRAIAGPGLLHKYRGRVLMIATGACAIHCRYCFRREFPYESNQLGKSSEQEALDIISGDTSLREVILSGGDPLVLNDERMDRLVGAIGAIPHIARLRIHTRLPIVLPSRITAELIRCLSKSRLRMVIVIHANHPAEFDSSVKDALDKLRGTGMTLLNQAVLLRGVNDAADTLVRLSETLFEHGILPYYLHLLDRVRGTAHFDVSAERARRLLEEMRARLPGYLVPRLVREEAGKAYKTPIA